MQLKQARAIGWIGLGRIGKPMVETLIADGHRLKVFDIDPGARNRLSGVAQEIGLSASDVARDAATVIFCVSDAKAVEDVAFGPQGIAKSAHMGTVLIDHSSTHPAVTREFARKASELGLHWVDAPISGGPPGAEARRLAAWLGGDENVCQKAAGIIKAYCSNISYMGPSGSGQAAKSCNQAIVANTIAIWSEMLAFAQASGLELHKLIGTLAGSSADSAIRKTFAHGLADGEFPELSTRNMIKDLEILVDLAGSANIELPHSALSLDAFRAGIDAFSAKGP